MNDDCTLIMICCTEIVIGPKEIQKKLNKLQRNLRHDIYIYVN